MGKESLPCSDYTKFPQKEHFGHADPTAIIILEDYAYCRVHGKRYKWRPGSWFEMGKKIKKEDTPKPSTA